MPGSLLKCQWTSSPPSAKNYSSLISTGWDVHVGPLQRALTLNLSRLQALCLETGHFGPLEKEALSKPKGARNRGSPLSKLSQNTQLHRTDG